MSTNLYPLYTKGLDRQFLLHLMTYQPVWKRLFHMNTTNKRYIWAQGWQGYNLPSFRLPGNSIKQDIFQPSFGKQYIVANYALGDAIAEEDIDDDLYAVIKFVLAQKGGYMAIAFEDLLEYLTAGFFATQGFATGTTVAGMADGLSLFNTVHPIAASNLGATYSNRPAVDADLSVAVVQAMSTALWTQKAPNNLTYLRNDLKKIVVNPALHYVAHQVTKYKWEPYSANRTENPIKNQNIEIEEWPYFTKSGSTGTNNAYFGMAEKHYCNFYMRSAPRSKTDYDIGTNSQVMIMMSRHTQGADDARGVWGSTGA